VLYLLISLFALSLMILLMPLLQRLARHIGAVDEPGERKVHRVPVPRIGGVLIAFTFLLAVLVFVPLTQGVRGLLVGALVVAALGLTDDLIGVGPWIKFAVQWIAAGGFLAVARPDLAWPLIGADPWLSWPLGALLIVFMTNAINLQDGLDGLAAGLVVIGGLCMGMLLIHSGEWITVGLLTALVAAVVGFLRVNTWPARIFMGDTGSYLLGFSLGSVFVLNAGQGRLPLWSGLLFFALPVFDTLQVMVRRMAVGRSPFHADRLHLHHRLLDAGLPHERVVYLEYMLASLLGLLPLLLVSPLKMRWVGLGLIGGLLLLFLVQQRGGAGVNPAPPARTTAGAGRVFSWALPLFLGLMFLLELSQVRGLGLKYGLLPIALSLLYAGWSWLRLRGDHRARLSITVTLIVATHFFVLHEFGFGVFDLHQAAARAWLVLGLVFTAFAALLLLGNLRRLTLIANPIEYFLIFGAVLLFYLPVPLKARFSTDLLGLEMVAFFIVFRVFTTLSPIRSDARLHAVASASLLVLLLVGWLR
jgi:UDP-GlcNAc:undecaprenyl-phosphate/decaprenyl-phosphate GlcNAc-1-phosphate transferase